MKVHINKWEVEIRSILFIVSTVVFLGAVFYLGFTAAKSFNASVNELLDQAKEAKELCAETSYRFYESFTSDYVVCLNEYGEKLLIDKNEVGGRE